MKSILFIIGILFAHVLIGQEKSEIHVITHENQTIYTNPKKGTNSFSAWGVFPEIDFDIRRITMHVTLAYPRDRAIAHWDYLDHIMIRRTGGVEGDSLNYEIGRMLTPYGSNFKEDWSYTWKVDVTDFHAFLRDSVEIEYIHTGYESPDLGWDLSIDFEIMAGPVPAAFRTMEVLWDGSFQYGNPDNDIEKHLHAISIKRKEDSKIGRVRIQHTGHGMDRPSGCSEFCNRWREIILDGKVIDHRDMWKDCGDNPLYPQGGTWIFDRAYWCPGDLQEPDIFDFPLKSDQHSIDLDMKPFTANDLNQPREVITAYLFQFSDPAHKYDVAMEEIMAPSMQPNYNRINPAGFEPRIKIRNLGKEELKTLKITYGTKGFEQRSYTWKGKLAFWEEAELVLPGEIDANPGTNTFEVYLSEPNGKEDEWQKDNSLTSVFEDVPALPTSFVVDFLTNYKPEENALFIVNSKSDTVYMRDGNGLDSASNYLDTLHLEEGKYKLELTDEAGDGLEFWFLPQTGYGRLRLKDVNDNILQLFESDCGNGQVFYFRCDAHAIVDTITPYLSVNIFPRMVRTKLDVFTCTNKVSTLKLRILKDGEFMEEHVYTGIKDSTTGLDVRHLEAGRYVMEVYLDGEHKMNRRFNKR